MERRTRWGKQALGGCMASMAWPASRSNVTTLTHVSLQNRDAEGGWGETEKLGGRSGVRERESEREREREKERPVGRPLQKEEEMEVRRGGKRGGRGRVIERGCVCVCVIKRERERGKQVATDHLETRCQSRLP